VLGVPVAAFMPRWQIEKGESIMDIADFMTYYAILIIIVGVFQLVAAAFTAWLASKKGYGFAIWFFLGLFFGIISLLTIGFTPVNTPKHSNKKPADKRDNVESRRDYNMNETWECPKCKTKNPNNTYVCESCGYKIL
jgi:hypothetical protein